MAWKLNKNMFVSGSKTNTKYSEPTGAQADKVVRKYRLTAAVVLSVTDYPFADH